jgi:p-hydroxybenzoate 3-monooxygenase
MASAHWRSRRKCHNEVADRRETVTSPFLAGDAVHIVPLTGVKGLNRAASDVTYSAKALTRVWKCERFSWSLTKLMHRSPDHGQFERAMEVAKLDYIVSSITE